MISVVLFFFAVTFIRAGFMASGRESITGLVFFGAGLVLIIKPVLDALRYYRTNFAVAVSPHSPKSVQRIRQKKVHLKIVKSEDEKPTIH